ncbi:MAG: ABC transporter ATP-binding protein, partial [Pseudomonadota bacterium]
DFLDRLVTSTIVLEGDGTAMEYAGGYTDYLQQRQSVATRSIVKASTEPETPKIKEDHRQAGRLKRQAERNLAKLEKRMEQLQTEQVDLEAALADPDLFARDAKAFETKTERLARLQQELEEVEERWLQLELDAEANAS